MNKLKTVKLSLVISTILSASPAMAESQFLGDEYQAGKNKVSFLSENIRIAGNVFLPLITMKIKIIERLWLSHQRVVLKNKPLVFMQRKWLKRVLLH